MLLVSPNPSQFIDGRRAEVRSPAGEEEVKQAAPLPPL